MDNDKFILAIDHGTSGAKTALFSARGELAGFEFEPTPVHYFPGGGAEQDPEDWWKAITRTSQRLLARGLVPPDSVAAVAVSSTFSSTVAVGPAGRHLDNSLTWMDSRAAPYIKELVQGFPEIEGYNLFRALSFINKTGGGPALSGKDDIAHVIYWKRERPKVYEAAKWFLGSKDYLNLRLTGKAAASFDSMALFWVTDVRDPHNMRYDPKLIAALGVDGAKLPPMLSSVEVLGELTAEAAKELGLPAGVKVPVGSPDHQSAGVGAGSVIDFAAHIYIGTSSWVQCPVPFKKTDMFHQIASLPYTIPGKYYAANEQDIAGGALGFLVNTLLYPQNQVNPAPPPDDVYKRIDRAAQGSPAGANGVIFTPWLNGERTPVDDTTIRAGIHNLSMSTTNSDIVRAVLEGVALNTRWAFNYVERFAGRRLDPLNIVGGGAKSELWCRIFADVLGRTIRQVKDPIQTNARGAAFIAAIALGLLSFEQIPALVQIENTFAPDPQNRETYNRLFAEFVNLYKKNRRIHRRLNRGRGA